MRPVDMRDEGRAVIYIVVMAGGQAVCGEVGMAQVDAPVDDGHDDPGVTAGERIPHPHAADIRSVRVAEPPEGGQVRVVILRRQAGRRRRFDQLHTFESLQQRLRPRGRPFPGEADFVPAVQARTACPPFIGSCVRKQPLPRAGDSPRQDGAPPVAELLSQRFRNTYAEDGFLRLPA